MKQRTVTEKRFGEYHEDDKSITLRSRSATCGGTAWSLDEKMGQTYVHRECANTLAQRDYKQPQAVIYELSKSDRASDGE